MNNMRVNPFAWEVQFLGTALLAGNKHIKPPDVTDYIGIRFWKVKRYNK